jgi:hypothetical protein
MIFVSSRIEKENEKYSVSFFFLYKLPLQIIFVKYFVTEIKIFLRLYSEMQPSKNKKDTVVVALPARFPCPLSPLISIK